jgi:hypothetical protein
MGRTTGLFAGRMSFAVVSLIIGSFSTFPVTLAAQGTQGTQGQNAVYNANSNCCKGSSAFIDASMFVTQTGLDLCGVLNGILSNGFISGSIIDARGLPSTTVSMTCATNTTPWSINGNATILNVPSTILLPATAGTSITIPLTWILPAGTHLIGQGDNDPASGTPGTRIVAGSGLTGAMIQFGSSGLCSSPCRDITVEKLTLYGGSGATLNGIVNAYAGDHSWVDHVSIYQILGVGLSVSGIANDSGPYSNIMFDTGRVARTLTDENSGLGCPAPCGFFARGGSLINLMAAGSF